MSVANSFYSAALRFDFSSDSTGGTNYGGAEVGGKELSKIIRSGWSGSTPPLPVWCLFKQTNHVSRRQIADQMDPWRILEGQRRSANVAELRLAFLMISP